MPSYVFDVYEGDKLIAVGMREEIAFILARALFHERADSVQFITIRRRTAGIPVVPELQEIEK